MLKYKRNVVVMPMVQTVLTEVRDDFLFISENLSKHDETSAANNVLTTHLISNT